VALRRRAGVTILALVIAGGVAFAAFFLVRRPRADRAWAADQARLASVSIEGDSVRIHGMRDFRWALDGAATPGYRDLAFALGDVRGVWFALAPFANRYRGLAHSFLSFELDGERFVAVSVEARREEHERYSLSGGVLRAFELAYVIGTEEDLLGARAQRGDELFLYPSAATPAQARAILVDMMRRATATRERPEFYHTFLNNCVTNLRDHVNRVATVGLPWGWGVLLPGFSDALALEHGLLATDLGLEQARARFRVDGRVRAALADGEEGFGRRIRSAAGA